MKQTESSRITRWIALAAIILNVSFNFLSQNFPRGEENIKQVTDKYESLFTPAGYAFAIWGIIYLSFVIYGIYQLMPSQRKDKFHDRISLPLIWANVLSSMWIVAFRNEMMVSSVLIILLTLTIGLIMFTRARAAVLRESYSNLISIPFSLFAGWISVASIANISILLTSRGWDGGRWGEITWTEIMVVVATLLGIFISYRFRDIIYPLVVAWACVAIFFARRPEYHNIAMTAIASAISLVATIILILGAKRHQRLSAEREETDIIPSQF